MQEIILVWGEKRPDHLSQLRCYFFWRTNTGIERPINDCPQAKQVYSRDNSNAIQREIMTGRHIAASIKLKMMITSSALGKKTANEMIYLDVFDNATKIRIKGMQGFGMFEGRAEIDMTLTKKATLDLIKQGVIEVETLSAAIFEGGTRTPTGKKRSIILKK